jgi:hypothetical protein
VLHQRRGGESCSQAAGRNEEAATQNTQDLLEYQIRRVSDKHKCRKHPALRPGGRLPHSLSEPRSAATHAATAMKALSEAKAKLPASISSIWVLQRHQVTVHSWSAPETNCWCEQETAPSAAAPVDPSSPVAFPHKCLCYETAKLNVAYFCGHSAAQFDDQLSV